MRKLLIISLASLCAHVALGQANYEIRTFREGEKEALGSNYVNALQQTALGYLVVATKGDLQRFNGKVFASYFESDSASIGNVTALCSGGGRIWYGGFGGLLGYIDEEKHRTLDTLVQGSIEELISNEGTIWAFTKNGEYVRFSEGDTVKGLLEGERLITCVAQTGRTEFLVGTNEGLFLARFDAKGKSTLFRQVNELPSSKVTAVTFMFGGKELWVATEDQGVHIVSGAGGAQLSAMPLQPNGLTMNNVRAMFQDRAGRIWMGTEEFGLVRLERVVNGTGARYLQLSLAQQIDKDLPISHIIEDTEGNIWVGLFGGGLVQIIEKVFYQPFSPEWVRQHSINQLSHDHTGKIWLGIDHGLFVADMSVIPPTYNYHYVDGSPVSSIVEDRQHNLWLGTPDRGLYLKRESDKDFRRISLGSDQLVNAINSLTVSSNGVYASTKGGLFEIDSNGKVLLRLTTMEGLPHNNISHCFLDMKGRLWLANGSNRISYYHNGKVNFVEQGADQRIVDASHVLEDRSGRIWVSTLGSGIYVLEEGNATNISTAQGLPSNYCYQMLVDDDGDIWTSHQNMITQLGHDLTVKRTVASKDVAPVENTNITSLYKDLEGNIWITSTHGIVKYNPKVDRSRKSRPKVSISAMRLFNSYVEMRPGMELPYNKYSVQFDLTGISLREPDKVRFKYLLEGFSTQWSDVISESSIQFPRLEEGVYTLKVLAAKEDGEWTEEPVTYTFTINRPFWRSPWFYLLMMLGLSGAVIAFVRYRTMKLMRDKAELEQIVSERTSEIQQQKAEIEENRDEIARYAKDITDSIKYAKRLQKAIFPTNADIKRILPESFIFFRSKGIVSGDFYFIEEVEQKAIFSAVDCTGHGVPGGFMSIVANNLLNQAVRAAGLTAPNEILDYVNKGVSDTLHQTYEESSVKDGMDIALCVWDKENGTMEFSGAFNPLYYFSEGRLTVIRGDRMPVGTFVGEEVKHFTAHKVALKPGDMFYIFSDGFADQFGGTEGKKFKMRRFRDMLERVHTMPLDEQYEAIFSELRQWQGDHEQVDDIVILGVRIPDKA
jgi:ligand-binding sensor domain-containing protein/serine phosphatase RsbU (regulator of sigma subunit)